MSMEPHFKAHDNLESSHNSNDINDEKRYIDNNDPTFNVDDESKLEQEDIKYEPTPHYDDEELYVDDDTKVPPVYDPTGEYDLDEDECLKSAFELYEDDYDNYFHRPPFWIINIPQYEPSGKKTLGEIFAKCKEFPEDAVFVVVCYDSEKKSFWCPDELINEISIRMEEHCIVAHSGYYNDRPKERIITNAQFLYSCDPSNTGCVNRKHFSKETLSEWIIDNNTSIFLDTKLFGYHIINDVIFFEFKDYKYIGLVVNA